MQIVIDLGDRRVRRLAALVVAAALIWWVADSVVNAAVPHPFHPGAVISSADVHENFTDLDSRVTALAAGQVPIGTILDYWTFGQTLSIPAGFEVCDGGFVVTSGSPIFGQVKPDLTDQFVRGTDSANDEGDTGGVSQHSFDHNHTISAAHQHAFTAGGQSLADTVQSGTGGSVAHVTHSHQGFTETATAGPTDNATLNFTNLPPFVTVLNFIRVK